MVRVKLPYHLQNLARSGAEVDLDLTGAVTIRAIIDALEAQYPALKGTIRDHTTGERRAFLRYFACQEDISFAPIDEELPAAVAQGKEPFMIVGAIAGG